MSRAASDQISAIGNIGTYIFSSVVESKSTSNLENLILIVVHVGNPCPQFWNVCFILFGGKMKLLNILYISQKSNV